MVYQATQRIHFAQGEMATFSTYIAWPLMQHGYGYWSAFIITLAVSFIGGAAIQRLLLTRKTPGPALTHIMIFIALLMLFNTLSGWLFEHTIKPFLSPFETGSWLQHPVL